MRTRNRFHIIGVMSGTSLDGLDLAYCIFDEINYSWKFKLLQTQFIPYNKTFQKKLSQYEKLSALDFVKMDTEFGFFIGKKVNAFIKKYQLSVDFVASHGHTIFHQPQIGITSQIGNGAAIAAESGITTICDFRRLDIALHGQGAPLVPIGDKILFPEYDFCLNLGGFANVSFEQNNKRIAFDICPVNIVANELCSQLGKQFDKNGAIAKRGKVNTDLLLQLNNLKYYKQKFPKSLGKEWVLKEIFPHLKSYTISVEDKLRTFYEHIAIQISIATKTHESTANSTILVTGGGAFNLFLIERIKANTNHAIIIPDKKIIEFKEAIIFAFLGVLRIMEQKNCLQSVTGATADNVGGCVYLR